MVKVRDLKDEDIASVGSILPLCVLPWHGDGAYRRTKGT